MSDFKFPCPKCGQNILCDSSNAGMQIPCPVCQTMLTVPPAPPPPPAAPGKLSINKTAHHPPPPAPGAAGQTAAPQPAWGAKVAPKKAKKKFPTAALGSIVALLVAGAIGWFVFGAPYFKQRAEEQKKAADLAAQQAEEKRKADEEAARPKPPKPTWKLDLASAVIPDLPAAGKHHGVDFKAEDVLFQNGFLILRQETGSSRQFVISVPLKPGETLPGKAFDVAATNILAQPRVTLNWKDDTGKPPGAQNYTKGYAMKLEFAAAADGNIPGKIYLSLPDPEQSFVAGTFEIAPKKPAGQPGAAPAAGEAPRKRKKE